MLRILVIDDEIMLLDVLTMLLNKFGYHVETATNGKEGIQKFDTGRFDLIITDMAHAWYRRQECCPAYPQFRPIVHTDYRYFRNALAS